MYSYEVTATGYRIYANGVLCYVQEGKYATVYPGETMEERAENHVADLTPSEPVEPEVTDEELLAQYEEALNILGVETEVANEADEA